MLAWCVVERLRKEEDLEEANVELLPGLQYRWNEWAAPPGAVPDGERPPLCVQRYCRAVKTKRWLIRGSCVKEGRNPSATVNKERSGRRTNGEVVWVEVAHLRVDVKRTIVDDLDPVRAADTTPCRKVDFTGLVKIRLERG